MHVEVELTQPDLNAVLPFDDVEAYLGEVLESEVVPSDGDDLFRLHDVGVNPLSPGVVIDVGAWHRDAIADTERRFETELGFYD